MCRVAQWIGIGVCLVALSSPVEGVIFHDGASNAQRMIEFITEQAQEVQKYAQMVEQARSMAEQVSNTVTMIEQGAKHLTDMPSGSNMLDWVTITTNRSMAILGRVQSIGFQMDNTAQQFETLYRNTSMLLTPEGREERLRQMQAARLGMSGVSMQVQSIRDTFSSMYDRLAVLLGASSFAEGTRALNQLQMQQRALSQKQFELGLAMQNAAQFMDGFHALAFRPIGQGRGFQLPR